MLVKGVKRRSGYGRYRFVTKVAEPSTTNTPIAIGAGAIATAASVGYKVQLQPRQGIWIRRYLSAITDAAGGAAHLWAVGGEGTIQKSPFGIANAIIGYPVMNELSIGGTATTFASPFGQVLSDTAVLFVLVDDWYEYDDALGNPLILQLQTFWKVANSTAGALNVTVQEQLTYDLYEGSLLD